MPVIKKTPAKKPAAAKKPVVKKVAAKRTTTAKTTDKVQKGLQNALPKAAAKSNTNSTKLPTAINALAKATTDKAKAAKPVKKSPAVNKTPLAPTTVKFSALPKNALFALGGRTYVKNFQGKALLLPPSVNVTKGDVKISAIHVMATEVVVVKANALVARV